MKKKQDPIRKIKKLHSQLMDIYFDGIKMIQCTKCGKKINMNKILECRKQFCKVSKKYEFDSQYPILLVNSAFITSTPYVLCKNCQYDLYRFIGKIPDIHDDKVFPQILSVLVHADVAISQLEGKTKTRWLIHYQKKTYQNSKKQYNSLLRKAVSKYLKKYPDIPYSKNTLFKIIKSSRLSLKADIL